MMNVESNYSVNSGKINGGIPGSGSGSGQHIYSSEGWKNTTKENPCPICGKDGCTVSLDGGMAGCRRNNSESTFRYTNPSGVHIHRLKDDGNADRFYSRDATPHPRAKAGSRENHTPLTPAELHSFYRSILKRLPLIPEHVQLIQEKRGLPPKRIAEIGFRTWFPVGVKPWKILSIARRENQNINPLLVPGVYTEEKGKDGKPYLTFAGGYYNKIAIPVRDENGYIVGIRINTIDGDPKYLWLSSAPSEKYPDRDGTSPGSPFYFPDGASSKLQSADRLRVTEGEYKAETSTLLTGVLTVSIPGVGTQGAFVNWFKERYPDPASAPILEVAFDADAVKNKAVATPTNSIVATTISAGYNARLLMWPESAGKGIDDVLLAGKSNEIQIFEGVQAKHEADRILQSAKAADKAKRDAEQQEKIDGLISAYRSEGGLEIFRDEERLSTLYDIYKHDTIGFNSIKKVFQKSGDVKAVLSIIKEYEGRLSAQKNKVVNMSGQPVDGDQCDSDQAEAIPLGGIHALRPIRECLFGSADAGTTDPSTTEQDHATEPEDQAQKAARENCPIPASIGCPPAYKISMGAGILLKSENPDSLPQTVSRRPIVPIHRYIDTATGLEQVKIAWFEPSGNYWKSTIVPRSVAASAQKILTVADNGLPVSSDNAMALCRWLVAVIVENPSIPITETTSKFGWIGSPGGAFLLGCDVITAKASSNPQGSTIPEPTTTGPRIQFDSGSEPENANLARSLEPRGSFEGWQEMATEATAESPLGAVVMAASFAAPLLSLLDLPGFVIELAGATSQGKTITTKCAASVWGNPEPAARAHYLNTWNLTAVALERLLGTLNHLPVILDDTQQAPKKMDLPEKIYHIAGGQGRGRGAKNPGSRQHVETWQTIGISSGEQPITGFGAEGGAVARSIILWCSGKLFPRFNAEQADRIQASAQDHYGHAGRRFIQWIVDNPTDAKRRIRDEYDRAKRRIIESGDGSGVLSRISGYLAIVEAAAIVAGEILGIDGLARGVVSDEVIRLASLEATKANRADEALEAAWRWANLESERFWNNDAGNKDEFFPAGGWAGRMDWTAEEIESWPEPVKERTVTMLAFNPDALRGYLARIGYQDHEAIVRTWADRGYIETDKDRASRLTKKIKIRGASARYVAVARATIERLSGIDPNELEENDIFGPMAG